MRERVAAALGPLVGIALFGLAAWVLQHELREFHYRDVMARAAAIPGARIALALLLTGASYVCLTGYDALALRWAGARLSYPRVALGSIVAYVFSHNIGLSFFGGSAVRFRMFSAWGVTPAALARAIPFNVVTFWLGFLALGGATLWLHPLSLPASWHPGFDSTRPLALAMLAALGVWFALSLRGACLRFRGFELPVPGIAWSATQTALAALDWALAAGVLYTLLPAAPGLSFATLLGAYLLAQVGGLISHVPAGLGVFETLLVVLLAPQLPGDAVLGAALAYRVVYYLIPLCVGLALFVGFEALQRRQLLRRAHTLLAQWAPELLPRLFAVAIAAAGVLLVLSGATPAAAGRLELLDRLLPLAVVELSHLVGSLIGVALVLLARAIQQRVDAAYGLTLTLLLAGAVSALLKGFDWEEASVLAAMALALAPCHRFFYRRASLFHQPFSPGWVLGIAMLMLGSGFVVLLAYRHVEYAHELWWQFELQADAPRSLRALAGAALGLAIFAVTRLLRPAPPPPHAPSAEDLARVAPLVAAAPSAEAHLALVGDKRLLFDEAGRGFLMYGVRGHSFVAMGDPIGAPEVRRDLVWSFRELADRHGGMIAFYEVGTEDLPLYLDLGLALRRIGEEARVPLADFSLEGSARKGLRATERRALRDGCRFELAPRERVTELLPAMREISDAWLASRNTREKRFSLGFFDPDYLQRTPLALVWHGERLVAFANVWASGASEELSIDLMRHRSDAPPGVMDFLFVELLRWGQSAGYRWFSLGMAPLSGFEHRRFSPLWNRLGALLFRHGEHFYNFQGLRSWKSKFDPVWAPRYLAAPSGLSVPFVLTDVASLISGGIAGVVAR